MGAQSLPGLPSEANNSGSDTPQIDGEIQLHLRRLSKREPVTKLKALQASCLPTSIPVTFLARAGKFLFDTGFQSHVDSFR